ncbi:hypothetical protein JCM30394_10830 [Deferrisoma palaeochoriense]
MSATHNSLGRLAWKFRFTRSGAAFASRSGTVVFTFLLSLGRSTVTPGGRAVAPADALPRPWYAGRSPGPNRGSKQLIKPNNVPPMPQRYPPDPLEEPFGSLIINTDQAGIHSLTFLVLRQKHGRHLKFLREPSHG